MNLISQKTKMVKYNRKNDLAANYQTKHVCESNFGRSKDGCENINPRPIAPTAKLIKDERAGLPTFERSCPFIPTCKVRATPDTNESK
jgi:hypothetical protein